MGQVGIIAFEEPYHFAHLLDTPDACQYPVERIVDEVLKHVGNLRDLFGDIPVGTIEPIWSSPRTEPGDMEIWLDTFEETAGEPFAFLHVDPDCYRPNWAAIAIGIEEVADARRRPLRDAVQRRYRNRRPLLDELHDGQCRRIRGDSGRTPQQMSFQSWVDWPDHVLPEDDLSALTSGIVRYFGQRVDLSVEATDEGVLARLTWVVAQVAVRPPWPIIRTTLRVALPTFAVIGIAVDFSLFLIGSEWRWHRPGVHGLFALSCAQGMAVFLGIVSWRVARVITEHSRKTESDLTPGRFGRTVALATGLGVIA